MQERNPEKGRENSGERGVILLLTLFIVAILCVIVLEFNYSTRVEYHIASGYRDELKALNIARAGVEETIALLRVDRLEEIEEKEEEEGTESFSSEKSGRKESESGKKSEEEKSGAKTEFEYADYYGEDWAQERVEEPFGEGFLSVKVIDESGKININTLVKEEKDITAEKTEEAKKEEEKRKAEEKKGGEEKKTTSEGEESAGEGEPEKIKPFRMWGQKDKDRTGEESEEEGKKEETTEEGQPEEEEPARYVVDKKVEKDIMRLIEELDIRGVDAEELTPAIVDWMDSNDEGDYEEDAYDKGESPPKNAPLDLLSELLMVKGVTGDLYFGPKSPETIDLEKEQHRKKKRRRTGVGLRDCLTAYSKSKVNVNTAPPEVLAALLEEENESLVKEITSYTKKGYFEDRAQFEEEIGEHIPASFMAKIGVGSDTFQIISEGRVNEARVRIRAYVQRDDEANVRILQWRVEG